MNKLILTFIPIFVAIDAVGIAPIYLALTEEMGHQEKKRVVLTSLVTAMLVSLSFIFIGKALLDILGVTVADFRIAGGIILLVLSVNSLLMGEKYRSASYTVLGAVPIGVPLIVGPAVLTTILILVDHYGYTFTLISLVINLLLAALVLHEANHVVRIIGEAGTKTVSKITALLLGSIAVRMIRLGVLEILQTMAKS